MHQSVCYYRNYKETFAKLTVIVHNVQLLLLFFIIIIYYWDMIVPRKTFTECINEIIHINIHILTVINVKC